MKLKRLNLERRIPSGALSAKKHPGWPPAEYRLVPIRPESDRPEAPNEAESKADTER